MKSQKQIKSVFNNILVTGGCGFIGSNFIRYLLKEENYTGKIINLDKLTYAGNPENLRDIAADFKTRYIFEKADICDAASLEKIFTKHDIDAICHFAAESHVDRSIKEPSNFVQTNIIGTFNLLELAKSRGDKLKIFHHVSTDEVYGSLGEKGLFKETTSYKPNSPYSASKAASDQMARAYFKTFGLWSISIPGKIDTSDYYQRAGREALASLWRREKCPRLALRGRSLPRGMANNESWQKRTDL